MPEEPQSQHDYSEDMRDNWVDNPDLILSRSNVFDALDSMFKETGISRGTRQAMVWYKSLVREMFEQTDLSPEETILRDRSRIIQKTAPSMIALTCIARLSA